MAARANGVIELTVAEIALLWNKVYGVWDDSLNKKDCLRSLILDLGAEGIEQELKGAGVKVRHTIDDIEDTMT